MNTRQTGLRIFTALAATLLLTGSGLADELLICERMNAKEMPHDLPVPAMKFTGPAGDGRRGSAGFVVQPKGRGGTRLLFSFQRAASGYGFQIIHPLGKGHVVVSVHSRGMTIHRGGSWGDIGWGDPAGSDKLELNAGAKGVPPASGVTYQVVSELSADGRYRMVIDDQVVCQHSIEDSKPLVLDVSSTSRVWGGSSWDRTPFAGENFEPALRPGHVGLILGPMDGSGPTHNFRNVRLTSLPGKYVRRGRKNTGVAATTEEANQEPDATDLNPLLRRVDDAQEFGRLVRSKTAGGSGGGAFESTLDEPTLLAGFDYTLSTFFGGHLIVKSVRPVYQTRDGEKTGQWHGVPHGTVHRVTGKEGYVVTAIVARHGHRLDGLRLIYMKVRGDRLNPDDTYRSKWIGGLGGGGETLYGTYGNPVVSIFGRQGSDLDSVGFVQLETK